MMSTLPEPAVAKMVRKCLWHVDAGMDKGGWDQNSALWAVVVAPAGPDRSALSLQPLSGWPMAAPRSPDVQSDLVSLTGAYTRVPAHLRGLILAPRHGDRVECRLTSSRP